MKKNFIWIVSTIVFGIVACLSLIQNVQYKEKNEKLTMERDSLQQIINTVKEEVQRRNDETIELIRQSGEKFQEEMKNIEVYR